jgi:lantibiotic modifying enzyme
MAGIIALYGILDEILPEQGWDVKAHTYIKVCLNEIEKKGLSDYSLLGGLAGVCFGISLASKQGTRYQQLILNLENFLIEKLESTFFKQVDEILITNKSIPPNLYNFSFGISGVLAYLILRKEKPEFQKLASDCLYALVRLLNQTQVIDGMKVPAWHVAEENQEENMVKIHFPKGGFMLDKSLGITGCLSILTYASLKGLVVSGQLELISKIANWLKEQKIDTDQGPAWPHYVGIDHHFDIEPRDIWNFGTPAITSTLFLAGKVTKDQKLMDFAEASLLPAYSKEWQTRRHIGPSFISGRAGLLVVTSQMARLTGNPVFHEQIPLLTEDLTRFYSPDHRFGFQTAYYTTEDDQYHWIDHPGLWEGAIGIALSLLMASQKESKEWQIIFLANS